MKKIIVFSMILLFVSVAAFAGSTSNMTVDLLETGFAALNADLAVGEAIQVGTKYIIPLFEANTFFLGGGGGNPVMGAGALGSLNLIPYAVIIISEDDFVVKPVVDQVPFLEQLVGVLPEVLPLVMQFFTVDSMSMESHEVPVQIQEQPIEDIKMPTANTATTEEAIDNLYEILLKNPDKTNFKGLKIEVASLMQKAPDNPKVLAMNGYITLILLTTASPLEQMKYALEAQTSINKALSMDSSSFFANLANGWLNLYSPMGQISTSIKGFKNAIDAKPEHPEAYFGIVEAYVKTGDMETAREFAGKGKEIDPDSSEYFDELLNK